MQTRTHAAKRAAAQHYSNSCNFFEQFDADYFEHEVETDICWMGFNCDEDGELQLCAEYIFDAGEDSGKGWHL